MSRIIRPPRAQEMSAAGPAAVDASSAPNNQPEPMIVEREMGEEGAGL